ncbi:MAG: hypothetical protein NW224_13200 [Leptolyngbyaceae cyanobacterium bins.302]|nr:hypothetical protein [Leptolyngbyaceae cyanobacterium bins.302]
MTTGTFNPVGSAAVVVGTSHRSPNPGSKLPDGVTAEQQNNSFLGHYDPSSVRVITGRLW